MSKFISFFNCLFKKKRVPEISNELKELKKVFKAPPLTKELIKAVNLISPHLELTQSEASRAWWEADQNATCWSEYKVLEPLFKSISRPEKILEIGPGMGRSLVFLNKKFRWEQSEFHAYEGGGNTTKYTMLGPRFEDSFCGNIPMLKHLLAFNLVNNVTVFNASEVKLAELPGPYDFIYSFYSVGYHWSLEHFLKDILQLMNDNTVAIFTVPDRFEPFPALEPLAYKIIDCKSICPKNGSFKMIVLRKKSIPV